MSLFGKKYPDNRDDDSRDFEDVYAGPGMMGETGYNDPDTPEDPEEPEEPEKPEEPEPAEKPVKPRVMNRPRRTITGKVYAGPGMMGGDAYDPEPEYRSVYAGPPAKKESWIKRLFSRKK